jgi:transposase
MGAAYSQDLRDRVLSAYDRGMASKQISELFAVSRAWVRRVKQRRRENGRVTPMPMGGLRVMKIDVEALKMLVSQTPDATIRELHQQLQSRFSTKCSESAVGMALGRLGFTFKKRRSMPRSRIGLTSPSAAQRGNRHSTDRKPND